MHDLSHTVMDTAEEMAIHAGRKEAQKLNAAYLDREAEKTPRARLRARTLRVAASNVRAGLRMEDEIG